MWALSSQISGLHGGFYGALIGISTEASQGDPLHPARGFGILAQELGPEVGRGREGLQAGTEQCSVMVPH